MVSIVRALVLEVLVVMLNVVVHMGRIGLKRYPRMGCLSMEWTMKGIEPIHIIVCLPEHGKNLWFVMLVKVTVDKIVLDAIC